ncbi:MAG: RNA polymerase sigma factor [Planctomycetota bacterium]|jgi:RNA polymerase sigma-70 factor (ECF subfamily)
MDEETRSEVERALAGDRTAFEALIRKYSRLVYAKAYSLVHQREEAEDLVQETFLKAFEARERLREPEKFPQWILSIARNRAIDTLRRRNLPLPLEEGMDPPDPQVEEPGGGMEAGEMRKRLFDALTALPERHRLAITLRYLEGMDYRGIEAAMGITNGAVRGILARSLQTLRKTLRPWIQTEGHPTGALRSE